MIRLAIIFFLISMIESEDCNFTIDDVHELKQHFLDSEHRMEVATRGQKENAIIILGKARSGKSTLINYLMGNTLVGYKYDKYTTEIRKVNENIQGPQIGSGSVSVSTIPTKWNSKRPELQNLDIWDTAGFDDNRGAHQDLNNSFDLYHLTRKVENLKFILVIDFVDINGDNAHELLTFLKTLNWYFNKTFKDSFPSISVVISKSPHTLRNRPVDATFLNYRLNYILLSNPKMDISNDTKEFAQHLINNSQREAFFRKAKRVGAISSDLVENIIPAIINSTSIRKSSHQNVGFTMSTKSKLCLQQTDDHLLDMNDLFNITLRVNNIYFEDYRYLNNTSEKNVLLEKKKIFQNFLSSIDISSLANSNAKFKLKLLEKSDNTVKRFITERNLEVKINLTEFIDSIIMSGKIGRINILLEAIVKLLYDRTTLLISFCQLQLTEINIVEYKKRLEEEKKLAEKLINDLNEKINEVKKPKAEESFWQKVIRLYAECARFMPAAAFLG